MWTGNSSYWVTHSLLLWKKRLSLNIFNSRFRICTKFITFPSNYSKERKRLDWCSIWNWIAYILPGFSEYPLFFPANWSVFLPDLTESPLGIMRKLLLGAITAAKGLLNPRFDGLRIRQEDSKEMKRRKLHILKKTKSISFPVSGWKREKKKLEIHTNSSLAFTAPWWSITHSDHDSPFPFILSDSQSTTPCFNDLIIGNPTLSNKRFTLWTVIHSMTNVFYNISWIIQ